MLVQADARRIPLRDSSVNCCVCSPPYWGLRDYGTPGQLGLEPTPEQYVEQMVAVFREVRRVLKADGTCWVNLGDSYNGVGRGTKANGLQIAARATKQRTVRELPSKNLVGIPWRVAFALQADGWYLRSDIIWSKPNPMPESVRDRPTKAHEYVFLLAKSERYWFDAEAVREADTGQQHARRVFHGAPALEPSGGIMPEHKGLRFTDEMNGKGRNIRSVWTVTTQPYPGAHFAVFPEELPKRCILAGCPVGGIVLDPFVGSGTTVRVARSLGRHGIGLDISAAYLHEQATKRVRVTQGLPL